MSKSIISNYSITSLFFALVHLLAPLIFALVVGDFLELTFFTSVSIGCLISVGLTFGIMFGGDTTSATGRSFRTKHGATFDEYETKHIEGVGYSSLHSKIATIHLFIMFGYLYWIYQEGKN